MISFVLILVHYSVSYMENIRCVFLCHCKAWIFNTIFLLTVSLFIEDKQIICS
jgi:hypothetical protein